MFKKMTFEEIGTERESKSGHDGRGGEATAGDVSDDEGEMVVVDGNDAVPVSAYVDSTRTCHIPGGDVELADRRVSLREECALQRFGDVALLPEAMRSAAHDSEAGAVALAGEPRQGRQLNASARDTAPGWLAAVAGQGVCLRMPRLDPTGSSRPTGCTTV